MNSGKDSSGGEFLASSSPGARRCRARTRMRRKACWHGLLVLCLSADSALSPPTRAPPDVVIFSGGSAWNGLAQVLSRAGCRCAHVMPVTDDGGSTFEVRRVFAGPAVGDIRNRLSMLELPSSSPSERALRNLLRLRLNEEDEARAHAEWRALLREDHAAWKPGGPWVAPAQRLMRMLDLHLSSGHVCPSVPSAEEKPVDAAQQPEMPMQLANASVGNLLLTALRLSLGSLEVRSISL